MAKIESKDDKSTDVKLSVISRISLLECKIIENEAYLNSGMTNERRIKIKKRDIRDWKREIACLKIQYGL